MSSVWFVSPPEGISEDEFSFEQRKTFFFQLLKMLMERKKIYLAANGKPLKGTINEQLNRLRAAFPLNEKGLYHGLWFTFDECPGGIVWIHENGYEDWT